MNEGVAEIVEKILNEELPEGFTKEKNQLLAKLMQEPSDEAVKTYGVRKGINLEEARERLKSNYQKEVEEVQFKEIALRLSNGMKLISPKVMGLEQREMAREEKAKEALRKAEIVSAKVDGVVSECRKLIDNSKDEVAAAAIVEVNKKLDLSVIVRELSSIAFELESLRQEVERMKENTLKNRIKKFFGIK